jgi:ABC-type phosphonate transport system ATPase subunit
MARELDLSPEDMFMPKPDGQKAIQVKAHLLDSN